MVRYAPGNGIAFIPNEDSSVTIENTGATIEIIDNYWYINGVNTEAKALGTDGTDGIDGITPIIEIDPDTKIWMINGASTGVVAEPCITKEQYVNIINLLDSINTQIEEALNQGV